MTSQFPSLTSNDNRLIETAAASQSAAMVDFAQRLIRTESPSGQEEAAATLVKRELERIGVDDTWIDGAGNVVAVVRGASGGRSMHFNTHLDHVSAGDLSLWRDPPFDAVMRDDVIYGRGASDVKGAMAAQVHGIAVIRELGWVPPGDVYFAGVVLEEVGGFGSEFFAKQIPTEIAVIGEATGNKLRIGHRGRVYVQVSFIGVSAHASAPERAVNPHFGAARFLERFSAIPRASSELFGESSTSPTQMGTDQVSGNVTPGRIDLFIDWRNVPGEEPEAIRNAVASEARKVEADFPGLTTEVSIETRAVRTYTGLDAVMPSTRGFATSTDSAVVQTAVLALGQLFGRSIDVGTWTFATDGGHLAAAGIECIGFAPGSETHAHTIHDQISISHMIDALAGNVTLAMTLGAT
ncbi:YgeY family selenium metabolism-linked hydrolase [soil metagenome]